jgi:hypothetical protein
MKTAMSLLFGSLGLMLLGMASQYGGWAAFYKGQSKTDGYQISFFI